MTIRKYRSKPIFLNENTMGVKIAVTPNTKPILAIFEPTTFPITIPGSPFRIAIILTINSGRLVPNATNVMPTTRGGILNFDAIDLLPKIRKSAPK
jgi:hypothetical protein